MKFDLYKKDGEFRLDCDDLQICLSSVSLYKLFTELHEDIYFIYEEYGQAPPDNMSINALVLRDKIQELMGDEK